MDAINLIKTILAIASPIFACGVCYAILKITEKGLERLSNKVESNEKCFDEYKVSIAPAKISEVYEYVDKKTDTLSAKVDSIASDVAFIRGKLNGALK